MDRTTRQAILIQIDIIEKQLAGIKTMLGMAFQHEQEHRTANLEEKAPLNYTSDKEDEEIDAALAIEASEKQKFLQELFSPGSEQ